MDMREPYTFFIRKLILFHAELFNFLIAFQ